MFKKYIIPNKTNDKINKMFYSCFDGFELTLEYDKSVEEHILGLSPISKYPVDTVYAHLSEVDINNPQYTTWEVYNMFTQECYTDDDTINDIIHSMIESTKQPIAQAIRHFLVKSQNRCPYCSVKENNIPLNNEHISGLFISKNNLVIDGYYTTKAKINYCPMCGRKLGD